VPGLTQPRSSPVWCHSRTLAEASVFVTRVPRCGKVTHLRPAANAEPAYWVVDGLRGFAQSVLSLVPPGFARYVRIFHPAQRQVAGDTMIPTVAVRWSEIAAANGTLAHAGMQLAGLTGSLASAERGQPGVFDYPPEAGSLPEEQAVMLTPVLARHTSTPDRCWFAIWEGFGGLPDEILRAPAFTAPHRLYHLLSGPVDALADGVCDSQSPNLCWPDDRTWCVATEIDLDTTYIGCDEACSEEILALPELEVLAIDPATGIDFASDPLNPVRSSAANELG
jgi:hypothetical protein